MKSVLLAVIVSLTLVSCASTQSTSADGKPFHRYPACVERVVGGRVLHDPGWVVEEHDGEPGGHFFEFMSTYWGRIIEVTRVNRFCSAIRNRMGGISVDQPGIAPSTSPDPFPR